MNRREKLPAREKGHPILLRLPQDMTARLTVLAHQRSLPLATVTRQLVKERLDQIDSWQEMRDARLTATQWMEQPVEERRRVLRAAAAAAMEEYETNSDLTDFEAFGEDDLHVDAE